MSNHPVHHCCDKHPRTRARVTTCPVQFITNHHVLHTSQMTAPKVNQNVTSTTPKLEKNNNSKLKKPSSLQCKGKGKWSVYKIPRASAGSGSSRAHVKLIPGCADVEDVSPPWPELQDPAVLSMRRAELSSSPLLPVQSSCLGWALSSLPVWDNHCQ